MKKYILIILSFLIFNLAYAGMSNSDKKKPGSVVEFIWLTIFYLLVNNLNTV